MELQNQEQGVKPLYKVLRDYLPKEIIDKGNKHKSWLYGYDEKYDLIIISKTGEIGEIYEISGLLIALPKVPDYVYSRSDNKKDQYWERKPDPPELQKIKSTAEWNATPVSFKQKWIPFIDEQYEKREMGFWFMNNGRPTYLTRQHWFYLQTAQIDVGYPDFREANRIKYIHWEACCADLRCFGQDYVKTRRTGHSFEVSSDTVEIGTSTRNARVGLLSTTQADAKKMFTDKVVPINNKLPFYFKPIMDGMDKPKTEISYRVPATKITKKNMFSAGDIVAEGLDTTIDYRSPDDNAFDGEKLVFLSIDEAGKLSKPFNLLNLWEVHKTCLRLGSKITGKCRMGSTVNALKKGGAEFKVIWDQSDVTKRTANGRTVSGLYRLFIPMEWNLEGHIDRYGMPVFRTPKEPVMGVDGQWIKQGAIDFWQAEVEGLKGYPDKLNEFYRQNPRTIEQAFRDESKASIFNLTKIYDQIDYNESLIIDQYLTRGSFHWKDGVRFSKVVWTPDIRGRFNISWLPPAHLQNNVIKRGDKYYPGNEHIGSFGCDPYDVSAVVGGRGSNGSLHGMTTRLHLEQAPLNEFFLEYIARPQTAEIFFEEVLMALWFYGMPCLIESNKVRLLYWLKNAGMRAFSMNRPDKYAKNLSATERELGGIYSSGGTSGGDVIGTHGSALESYIEKYIGYDAEGTYREPGEIGAMLFNRTLQDWAGFDINDRTRFDASVSSGLAIMANQKHVYLPEVKSNKIVFNFATYSNEGSNSRLNVKEWNK